MGVAAKDLREEKCQLVCSLIGVGKRGAGLAAVVLTPLGPRPPEIVPHTLTSSVQSLETARPTHSMSSRPLSIRYTPASLSSGSDAGAGRGSCAQWKEGRGVGEQGQ